jgi:hypothetical protein
MPISGIKTIVASLSVVVLGIMTSIFSFISPMKKHLLETPEPTPTFTEETRALSKEEQATMSASFIKEFETILSSRSGEKK